MENFDFKDRQVLYIDDEQENLDGFRFSFRKDFKVFVAIDIKQAWEIIESNEIKIIISDQRMPDVSGTDFLAEVAKNYPEIVRIILSAYADLESAMQAINKGMVYRFLTKPWNKNDLLNTLENAFETYSLRKENIDLLQNLKLANKDLQNSNEKLKYEIEVRKKAQAELANHRDNLEMLVKKRTEEIEQINEELIATNEEINSAKIELEEYKGQLEILVEEKTRELKNTIEELKLSETRFRTLFEQAGEGILVGNTDGTIVDANSQMLEITGYSREQLIGSNINVLFTKDQLQEKPLRYDLVNKGEVVTTQRILLTKTGNKIYVEMNSKKLEDGRLQAMFRDITQEKLTKKAIEENEEKFRLLFENANDAIFIFENRKVVTCNNQAIEMFRCTRKDIIGKTPFEIFPDKSSNQENTELNKKGAEFLKKVEMGASVTFERTHYRFDNTPFESEVSLNSINISGQIIIQGIIRDITERKLAENREKEQLEFLSTLLETVPIPVFYQDSELKFKGCNSAFEFSTGKNRNDIIGKTTFDLYPKDLALTYQKSDEQLIRRGGTHSYEGKLMHNDGKIHDFIFYKASYTTTNGDIIGIIGAMFDITERKEYENALKESESNLKESQKLAKLGYWSINLKTHAIKWSEEFYKIVGLNLNSKPLSNKEFLENIVHPDDKEFVSNIFRQLQKSDKAFNFDFRIISLDGKLKYCEQTVQPITDDNGTLIKIKGTLWDITDRKLTELALAESEKKFKNIFNNSNDAILISSFDGKFVEGNNVFFEKIQFTKSELDEKIISEIMPEEYKKYQKERIDNIKNFGSAPILEMNLVNKHGVVFPVELDSKLINYEGGKAILTVIRDIAERKMTEKKVLDAVIRTEEKEREKFAKNLHDDLGPLLSSIKMYMNSFTSATEIEKQLYIIDQVNEILIESIQTAKQISNDLSPHILTNYGLVSAIENFINKIVDHIKIHFDSNLKDMRFDTTLETTYYRIAKELINNTIKHAQAKNIGIKLDKNKNQLILKYSDDGVGFDIERIEKKGMGLYNLMSRIKSLDGKFEFERLNQGIKIHIEAPII